MLRDLGQQVLQVFVDEVIGYLLNNPAPGLSHYPNPYTGETMPQYTEQQETAVVNPVADGVADGLTNSVSDTVANAGESTWKRLWNWIRGLAK